MTPSQAHGVLTQIHNQKVTAFCMDTKGERGGLGGIGRLGLTHIHY